MPFKKGLLPLTGETLHKCLTTPFRTHTEHLQLGILGTQNGMARPPVYFRLKTKLWIQGNKYVIDTKPKPLLGIMYVSPHCPLAPLKSMLMAQPIVDPPCSVALLFGIVFVPLQPSVNDIQVGTQYTIRLRLSGIVTTILFPQSPFHRVS